jgi:hypothetical protein
MLPRTTTEFNITAGTISAGFWSTASDNPSLPILGIKIRK